MTTTWSGRIIPSLNQELGMEELAPLTFRYVLRDPPDEGQEGPMKPPSHDPAYPVNPGGHP